MLLDGLGRVLLEDFIRGLFAQRVGRGLRLGVGNIGLAITGGLGIIAALGQIHMIVSVAGGAAALGAHHGADGKQQEADAKQPGEHQRGGAQIAAGLAGHRLKHLDGRNRDGDQGRNRHLRHGGGRSSRRGVGDGDFVGIKGLGVIQRVLDAGGKAELARLGDGEVALDGDGLRRSQLAHGGDAGSAVIQGHALGRLGGIVGQLQGEAHIGRHLRHGGGAGGGVQGQVHHLAGIINADLDLVGGDHVGSARIVRQGDGILEGRAFRQGELLFAHQRFAGAQGEIGEDLAVLGVRHADIGIGNVAVVLDGQGEGNGVAVLDGGLVGRQDFIQHQAGIGLGDGDGGQLLGQGLVPRLVGHLAAAGQIVLAHGGGELDGLALARRQRGDGLRIGGNGGVLLHADVLDFHIAGIVQLILHGGGLAVAHHLGIDGTVDRQARGRAGKGQRGAGAEGLDHHVAAGVHIVIAEHIGQLALIQLLLGDIVGMLRGHIIALFDQRLAAVAKGRHQRAAGIIEHDRLGHIGFARVNHAHRHRNGAGCGEAGRLNRQGKIDIVVRHGRQRKQQCQQQKQRCKHCADSSFGFMGKKHARPPFLIRGHPAWNGMIANFIVLYSLRSVKQTAAFPAISAEFLQ